MPKIANNLSHINCGPHFVAPTDTSKKINKNTVCRFIIFAIIIYYYILFLNFFAWLLVLVLSVGCRLLYYFNRIYYNNFCVFTASGEMLHNI